MTRSSTWAGRFGVRRLSRRSFEAGSETINVWSPLYQLYQKVGGLAVNASFGAARATGLAVVKRLLPVLSEAKAAWLAWLGKTRSLRGGDGMVESSLSDDAASRMRFRTQELSIFSGLEVQARLCWSVYWQTLNRLDRRDLWETLRPSGLFQVAKPAEFYGQLKELSAMAKKFGKLLFPNWKNFVDLHLLRDYLETKKIEDFKQDIVDWVQGEAPHALKGSEELFLRLLRDGVTKFLETAPIRQRDVVPLTPEEWLADPANWARSGSSDGPRLYVKVEGDVRKARKNKWATALAADLPTLVRLFYDDSPQVNYAIQKRERGKVRAVLAGDIRNYLRMSYVSYWLEFALADHPLTTLFFNASEQMALWLDMEQETNERTVKIPIDESEYDHQVNKPMLAIANECIIDFISKRCLNSMKPWLVMTMRMIVRSLNGGWVVVGKDRIAVKKGILSGWRWTALYDTLLNGGKVEAFRTYLLTESGFDPVLKYCSQGDDVRCEVHNYAAALALWACYTEAGFDVNPGKFFIAEDRDEYLRQVAEPGVVSGYASRAIGALVFRNPVTRELARGEERIREQVSGWNTVFGRLGYSTPGLMISDIARSNHLEVSVVEALLRTPACLGGLGWDVQPDGEWKAITKGGSHAKWEFLQPPPLGVALARNWKIPVEEFSSMWHANVEPPARTEVEFRKFEVRDVVDRPIELLRPALDDISTPLGARANPLVPKSVSSALKEMIAKASVFSEFDELVKRWIDPALLPDYEDLKSRGTTKVVRAWVNGSLPFVTPVLPLWNSLAVSFLYTRFASALWVWAKQFSQINMNRVVRAAWTAEVQTVRTLSGWRVRLGG